MTQAMDAVQQALSRVDAFIEANGTPLDRLRRDVLLGRAAPGALGAWLETRQHRSGGFGALVGTSGADAEPDLMSTMFALAMLADVRGLRASAVEGAVAYLAACQRDDGAWRPAHAAAEPEVVALTAMLGAYLARSRRARPAILERAGARIGGAFEPARAQGFAWEGLAAFAHFFANVDHELSDPALQWCGRELERGYRTGAWDALRTVRVFTLCDVEALPGAQLSASALARELLGAQAGDGGLCADAHGAPALRVGAALDAALAWVRFAPPQPGARPPAS